jgi:putative acetyltransferase
MSDVIQRATVRHAQECAAIVNDWIDETEWMRRGPSHDEILQMLTAGIPQREFWVIGEPVRGYLSLDPGPAKIMGLYVSEPGLGLGKALMDKVKEGRDLLTLNTHEANKPARKFYEREGFRRVRRVTRGADGIPEIVMNWRR